MSINGKFIFYRWVGVSIDVSNKPPDGGPIGGGNVVSKERISEIIDVIPPVQFFEQENGTYLAGYFDGQFYAFSDVVVPASAVPPASPEHRYPILKQRGPNGKGREIKIITIPAPDHLGKVLAPFVKAPATKPAEK